MAYNLALFDLDGTLTESKTGIVNSVRYALSSMNLTIPNATILEKFVGPPLREGFGIDAPNPYADVPPLSLTNNHRQHSECANKKLFKACAPR